MAIVGTPKQVSAGRSCKASSDFNRTYTVVWRAIVDSPHDGPATFGASPLFPGRFAKYIGYENTDDEFALCRDFSAEPLESNEWRAWRVTAVFSTAFQSNQQQENPADEPPIFWIDTEFASKPITKDADGNDIKNSAGMLLEGIERLDAVETWNWERNYTSLDRAFWLQYQNSVNSDQFYELAPKTGLLTINVSKPEYRQGVPFWKVSYKIKVNKDKWTINPPDKGTLVKSSDGKLIKPIDQRTMQPIDGEVYLDGHGKRLDDAATAPVRIGEKDIYKALPFFALGL